MDFEAGVIAPCLADRRHRGKQGAFVEVGGNGRNVGNRAAIDRMSGREQSLTVAADVGVISRAEVEDRRALNFLVLSKGKLKAKV